MAINQESMTVYRALVELKTLKARIERKITEYNPALLTKRSDLQSEKTKKFIELANDNLVSILDLIRRYDALKGAVIESNAKTMIVVKSKTMSVAKAIEMKSGHIAFIDKLSSAIGQRIQMQMVKQTNLNNEVQSRALQITESRNVDNLSENALSLYQSYIDANEVELVTAEKVPDILEYVVCLRDLHTSFFDELDAALSVSNATTIIEFEYEIGKLHSY